MIMMLSIKVFKMGSVGSLNEERIKAEGMAAMENGWSGWVNKYRTPVAMRI